jgi:hypothetical protein
LKGGLGIMAFGMILAGRASAAAIAGMRTLPRSLGMVLDPQSSRRKHSSGEPIHIGGAK